MAFWGVEVKPGKAYRHSPDDGNGSQLHLSQATLGLTAKSKERVVLSGKVADQKSVLLCSLSMGVLESCPLDLIFDEEVIFSVKGSSSIHLSGYYMPLSSGHSHDDDEDEEEDYDDGYVDGEADEFDSDDVMDDFDLGYDEDDEDSEDDDEEDDEDDVHYTILQSGTSGVRIEEVTDEEAAKEKSKAPQALLGPPKVEELDEDKEEKEAPPKKAVEAKALPQGKPEKKGKKERVQNGDVGKVVEAKKVDEQAKKTGEELDEDEDGFEVKGKRPSPAGGAEGKAKKKQAVVSAQDTPTAAVSHTEPVLKSETQGEEKKGSMEPGPEKMKKKKKVKGQEAGGEETKVESVAATANDAEPPVAVAETTAAAKQKEKGKEKQETEKEKEKGKDTVKEKKEKKEKEKTKGSEKADAKDQASATAGAMAKASAPVVRRFPNGLEIHELAMGNPSGKQAKEGKRISMHYTGKLKNGKVFDSSIGKKPFSFRLGVGEVIKGWDVGVNGMRVGDKRRLLIPPQMAYGPKGVPGTIPGNAWLTFDVELIDVK